MRRLSLREQTKRVILEIGDIVIDTLTGHGGTLIHRKHHIDMEADDIYLWEVKWFNNRNKAFPAQYIEEESLKISIVAGTYRWHSINGGTFELERI
jgi:hypothetical protein